MSDLKDLYEMDPQELRDEVAILRAENAELRKQAWHDRALVDWYERRDREVGRNLLGVHCETWMRANPKP